jgi:hypothetical protein
VLVGVLIVIAGIAGGAQRVIDIRAAVRHAQPTRSE